MKKIFRKLHLWLSVPFGIFITLICFSGAMLVFEKEITECVRPELYFVKETGGKALPLDTLMQRVSATLPDSVQVSGVTVSSDPRRAYQVALSKPRRASLYVDQYTGDVLGRNERLGFFNTMFHLHRWMMGSSKGPGKLLVGLSTVAMVLILVTGVLMWLTNRRKPLRKSLTISFTKGWPRFWHDLHVAGGIYAMIFLLAIALTGLTWSFGWYRDGFYAMFGIEASAGGHGGAGGGSENRGRDSRGKGRPDGAGEGRQDIGIRRDTVSYENVAASPERPEASLQGKPHAEIVEDMAVAVVDDQSGNTLVSSASHVDNSVAVVDGDEARSYRRGRNGETNESGCRGRHGRGDGKGRRHNDADSLRMADVISELPDSGIVTEIRDNGANADKLPTAAADTRIASERGKRNRASHSGNWAARSDRRERGRKPAHAVETEPVDSAMPVLQVQSPFAHWQQVYENLAEKHSGFRQINIADGMAGVVPSGRNNMRAADRFEFDAVTGQITGCQPYSQQDKSAKVRSGVYTVHVGSWGGMLTRILTFLAVLLGATLPLTGYYLWVKKMGRKKHSHEHDHGSSGHSH